MSWPTVELGSLGTVYAGGTPSRGNADYWGEGIKWLSIKDYQDFDYVSFTKEQITDEGLRNSSAKLFSKGNVIISIFATLGRVAILGENMATNQAIAAIDCHETIHNKYLMYALKAQLPEIERKAGGVAQKNINLSILKSLQIPLPPLETQKQIAEVLEKADQLRKDCQQMEQELNSLAQSVFIDMFGDPVTNPKGWEMKALSELASIVTGNTPSRAKPEYYGSDIEWIKSGNINTPSDFLTVAEEYLSEDGKKAGRVVQSGAILMTCIAGSPDCIGNIAIADREVAFNQQINALVPMDKKLDTEFLYVLLKVAKKIIQSASTNSMKGMISKSKLESIQLPFPSYAEQCDFSAIFKKLQKEVKKHNEQVVETQLMFDALMQKAFKGELNL